MVGCFSAAMAEEKQEKWVLQLCHGYDMPFSDVARQYAALFSGTGYKVATVFLTGNKNEQIAQSVSSDDVIFLENTSRDIRGLKLKQIRQVRQLCAARNYQFCIAHRFKAVYIASHVSRLFVIGVQHAFGGYERWTRRFYIQRKQKNLALIGVSDAIRNDIRSSLPEFTSQKIVTLYNRIDINKHKSQLIDREQARNRLKLPKDAFVFANVGRLHPDKDQSTLLKAFSRISSDYPKAFLVIMGKGRLEASLKQEAESLGIKYRTLFTGAILEASRYFRAFDSFILPSNHEPFGMVLLEAMVAGLPIAACNTGAVPEVIGNTGMKFHLGDVSELSELMRNILGLSNKQKAEISQRMEDRLFNYFSDDAVKGVFWNLPFIQPFVDENNTVHEQEMVH
ncbi:glycosyltransferase [Endozoicomonas acroporae]|uniref:glycosyltransferase n=1 Tax=Endozoicomonas acroporae TaxID=1701104 RepID=UPI0019D65E06|nr:glycosyltransferase [Endozoicomonas acroporae]